MYDAADKLESESQSEQTTDDAEGPPEQSCDLKKEESLSGPENKSSSNEEEKSATAGVSSSKEKMSINIYNILLQLPKSDLRTLCTLLGREGYCSLILLFLPAVISYMDILLSLPVSKCVHFSNAHFIRSEQLTCLRF